MVVIGELSDNTSTVVQEGGREIIDAIIDCTESILGDSPIWVRYLPAEDGLYTRKENDQPVTELASHEQTHLIRINDGGLDFVEVPIADIEDFIDGPLRSWHATDYRSQMLASDGATPLDAIQRLNPLTKYCR